MLLILSAFAMGACQECDDNNVPLGLISYSALNQGQNPSCTLGVPGDAVQILFHLSHLSDGTLGFTYNFDCWVGDFTGTNDNPLPFRSSCEDPMWTGEGKESNGSTEYKSARHCLEPLLDTPLPENCSACEADAGVDIGYVNLYGVLLQMAYFANTNDVTNDDTYLELGLVETNEDRLDFTYKISIFNTGSGYKSQDPQSLPNANDCTAADKWTAPKTSTVSSEVYQTNRYCLQHHIETARKRINTKTDDDETLGAGAIAGIAAGGAVGLGAVVYGVYRLSSGKTLGVDGANLL